tara:strand:+ start:185 stop:955 length:771 start_codon:yes stop_codon:yes gene_type:complete
MSGFDQTTLGGGIRGIAPKITGITLDTSVIPRDRYVIRKAFANSYRFSKSGADWLSNGALRNGTYTFDANNVTYTFVVSFNGTNNIGILTPGYYGNVNTLWTFDNVQVTSGIYKNQFNTIHLYLQPNSRKFRQLPGEGSEVIHDITNLVGSTHVMTSSLAQTPFRLAMNAGDPMSRQNIGGGSDQVSSRVGGFAGLAKSYNGAGNGDGASGNQHFVYDSSDYIRFKKLQGKTRNYNDKTFGGSNNGSYSAIMRLRR